MALFPGTATPCPYPIPSLSRRTGRVSGLPGRLVSLSSKASRRWGGYRRFPLSFAALRPCLSVSVLPRLLQEPASNRCWRTSSLDSSTRFSLHPHVWVNWEDREHPRPPSRLTAEKNPRRAKSWCPRLWASAWLGGSRHGLWPRIRLTQNSQTLAWRLQRRGPSENETPGESEGWGSGE